MDTLLFLLSLGGMVLIVFWSLQNDKMPMDGKTHGLLAMKDPEEDASPDRRGRKMKRPLPTDRS